MAKPITDAELNAALNSIKGQFPEDAVCAVFVFQDTRHPSTGRRVVSTDFVCNANTKRLAFTMREWARGVLNGTIKPRYDPHGGRTH